MGVELVEGTGPQNQSMGRVAMQYNCGFEPFDVSIVVWMRISRTRLNFNPDSISAYRGVFECFIVRGITVTIRPRHLEFRTIKRSIPTCRKSSSSDTGQQPLSEERRPVALLRIRLAQDMYWRASRRARGSKEVPDQGGYGMLVGPAPKQSRDRGLSERIIANPSNYMPSRPWL